MSSTLSYSQSPTVTPIKWQLWLGRALSGIAAGMLVMSAAMKLSGNPAGVEMFVSKLGWPAPLIVVLAALELASVAIYLIPQTAVFGAILMTGYLGGAIATHFRVYEAPTVPLLLAIFAWAGLFLRDGRLRRLIPLRSL